MALTHFVHTKPWVREEVKGAENIFWVYYYYLYTVLSIIYYTIYISENPLLDVVLLRYYELSIILNLRLCEHTQKTTNT